MQTPKLIVYLKTFSDQDWKGYISFSQSFYNSSSSQAKVISFYKSKRAYLYQPDWGRDKLLSQIKPIVKAKALANIIAKLAICIEQYFIWQESQKDKMYSKSLLLESLAKRSLKKEFHKLKAELIHENQSAPLSLWNSLYMLRIEHLTYFENMTSDVSESKEILERIIQLSNDFYDNLLHYYNVELINREVTIAEDWTDVKNEIKDISLNNEMEIISQKLILLKKNRDNESYDFLKRIIVSDVGKYSKEINYTILIHLASHLINKIKKGYLGSSKELLGVYIIGLDTGLLINNGSIPSRRFSNILNIACGVKEFDWAEKYVDNYADLVDASNAEETKRLAKAEIYFAKGDFDQVIQSLISTKYRNFDQELKARWLLLGSEFELNRDNVLFIEDRVRSMKYYLKRNEKNMDVFTYKGLQNLCKFLLKLCKPYTKEKMRKDISETPYLAYRTWVNGKI